jgi:hypothetical protein
MMTFRDRRNTVRPQRERNISTFGSPLARGLTGLAGVPTRPAGNPIGGVPAVPRGRSTH